MTRKANKEGGMKNEETGRQFQGRRHGVPPIPVIGADVDATLKAPVTADRKFEEVVKSAQDAAVLVLVY